MAVNQVLRRGIMEAVTNQLRDNDPPETRQAYDRLAAGGLPDAEVRRLIACVLVSELYDIMKSGKPFDRGRYAANLARLPQMPPGWDDDD